MPDFKLSVADALALAAAVSDETRDSARLPSTGDVLDVFISKNGCRRVDVVVRGRAWMKLMAQNTKKASRTAARARAGAKIVHILPLDARGKHTNGPGWGMV
eukprot:CAMPEP_0119283190 /NCGR_PEP_ID=MMETSP1329-20130426/28084_1 /TAXON_ID=114041 /ORGANISM="Genus nov. species nov., Strain RCC1024" /LENGTH=101 /DNA_ID=CAMNT_0007283857 /DNA_START=174 /DNA_END=475 /DNA_ORIENTATION=-